MTRNGQPTPLDARPSRSPQVLVPAALALVVTCCTSPPQDGGTVHPTPTNRVPLNASVASRDSLPSGLSGAVLDDWLATRNRLLTATATVAIGADGQGPEMFGSVSDAKLDLAGNILVFDEHAQTIIVFDQVGRYVAKFGGVGDGPLELRRASRFTVLPDGRIAVPTLPSGLKIFAPAGDGVRWKLDQHLDLPAGASSICSSNYGNLLLSGWVRANNTVVHKVTLPAAEVVSFGAGYDDEEWVVRWRMSDGFVGCVDSTPRLAVLGFQILPTVHAYTLDGKTQWHSRIEDHIPMSVVSRVRPDGRTGVSRSRTTVHDLLGFIQGLGDHVILQYDRFLPDDRTVRRRTFLLDARTGHGAALPDTLPAITSVYSSGYLAVFEDPYPRVEYREYSTLQGSGP